MMLQAMASLQNAVLPGLTNTLATAPQSEEQKRATWEQQAIKRLGDTNRLIASSASLLLIEYCPLDLGVQTRDLRKWLPLPFKSTAQLRAKERSAALVALWTQKASLNGNRRKRSRQSRYPPTSEAMRPEL
jgi:hypothetical protein